MVAEDHPRPQTHDDSFLVRSLVLFFYRISLVGTLVCLTSVPYNHIALGRSAVRFAAAPDNSLLCSACATSQYEANVIFHMSWPRRIRRWRYR